MRLLVIVDMQNDFITGSLKNEAAGLIVPGICELISGWSPSDEIAVTKDTHNENYLLTREGKYLPIKHCVKDTAGWEIQEDIGKFLKARDRRRNIWRTLVYEKNAFGSEKLADRLHQSECFISQPVYQEIVFVGTCTDICVLSNAIIARTFAPRARIVVLADLCAGTSIESHEAALKVMQSCQIDVVDSKTYLEEISK